MRRKFFDFRRTGSRGSGRPAGVAAKTRTRQMGTGDDLEGGWRSPHSAICEALSAWLIGDRIERGPSTGELSADLSPNVRRANSGNTPPYAADPSFSPSALRAFTKDPNLWRPLPKIWQWICVSRAASGT